MPTSRDRRHRPSSRQGPTPRRPAPPPPVAPPASGLRAAVEQRSRPVLVWLSARPKLLLPVLSIALLIGGLALPSAVGVPLLLVLTALVGWLTYLSWPAADTRGKVLRTLSVGLLLVLVVSRL